MRIHLPQPALVVPTSPFPSITNVQSDDGIDEWLISFEIPARVYSINERLHWRTRSKLAAEWRAGAKAAARTFHAKPGRWYVVCSLPFRRDSKRRDPHNFTATVVKPLIDGLVDAGIWPDDTPEFVVIGDPIIRICPLSQVRHLVVGVHAMRMEDDDGS